jgi:hypothetical protein
MMQKTCLPDYNVLNTDICGLFFQFVHEEALACELAAYFYLELGDMNNAVEYFLLAHERYHEWVSSQADFVRMRVLICCSYIICLGLCQPPQREQ